MLIANIITNLLEIRFFCKPCALILVIYEKCSFCIFPNIWGVSINTTLFLHYFFRRPFVYICLMCIRCHHSPLCCGSAFG